MKRLSFHILLLSLLVPCASSAERTPGFSMSAFNILVPSSAHSAVFSPFSFEIDCALISEAFGALEKAVYVEALGALVGYDSVYKPITRRFLNSATNDFSLISARAYLSPSLRLIATKYRSFIQSEYGAHVCPIQPTEKVAENFMRVEMDGQMEDFRVPEEAMTPNGVSFCDLEVFSCRWAEPFPTSATCRVAFAGEGKGEVEMMSDVREAEILKEERYSVLRLPMAEEASFFVALPDAGETLDSIRGNFAAEKFDELLATFRTKNVTVVGGPAEVSIPKFTTDTIIDMKPAFFRFALPLGGFKDILIYPDSALKVTSQRVRFSLDERGPGGSVIGRKGAGANLPAVPGVRRFVCNRPFLYWVVHEPTRTVPVAGVFAGD